MCYHDFEVKILRSVILLFILIFTLNGFDNSYESLIVKESLIEESIIRNFDNVSPEIQAKVLDLFKKINYQENISGGSCYFHGLISIICFTWKYVELFGF